VVDTGIAAVFSGAYDAACTNLRVRAGGTFTYTSNQTLTVTTNLSICGCVDATTTVKSGTGSSAATITYNGAVTDISIYRATITDITFTNACYGYLSGTLTRTSGITDFTSNPSFYSDPGVANVVASTAYKYGSQVDNRTGTVTLPTVGQVKTGTAFGPSLSLTGTYDPVVPLASVKLAAETTNINPAAPTPVYPYTADDYLYAVLSGVLPT
jgi:hypothetical protein